MNESKNENKTVAKIAITPFTQEIIFNFSPDNMDEKYVEKRVLDDPETVCAEKIFCRGIHVPSEMAEISESMMPNDSTMITIIEKIYKGSYLCDCYERSISVTFGTMMKLGWPKFKAVFDSELSETTLNGFQKSFRSLQTAYSLNKEGDADPSNTFSILKTNKIKCEKTKAMSPWFFTFGSDPEYPFGRNQFVVVYAASKGEAIKKYQEKYPNRQESSCYNAADCYSLEKWKMLEDKYYPEIIPSDIIF